MLRRTRGDFVYCKYTTVENIVRVATGSEIFFPLERGCGGGFQKMGLRKKREFGIRNWSGESEQQKYKISLIHLAI